MFKNSSKIMFLLILILGTLITASANSWMGAWMGLEINLMSFIPLMNNINNLKSSEASLKYFLIQALASSVLLFTIILFTIKYNINFQYNINNNIMNSMIMTPLLLKSGTAPFHFWFPEVMEGLSWMNVLILMTWQKIAPLILISYLTMNYLFIIIIMTTTTVGAMGGLNQTSLRKLLAFSSINHLGWMMSGMMMNEYIWMIYFLFYSFLSTTIVIIFNSMKIFSFNQLFSMYFPTKYFKIISMINMLSMGGLPPFLGFLPKWMIIQQLSNNGQMLVSFFLVMTSLIVLFFYLRMTFSAFMINYFETNWMTNLFLKNPSMCMFLVMTFISTFGLPLLSFLFFML
uniref:NADH-ubiquinone oxidoreductase chain 2 n=1 Tax=Argyra pingwuensis TaxID=2762466 RepID=A0A7G6KSC0_9MUSC|nr:NADH dehydrogenase subunit 2 [Argyra pingwuensis]QNC71302.1 NADH dehydrogenase subunit 2 [Argyra pingwuensis]